MLKHQINPKLVSKRLLCFVAAILVSGVFSSQMAEAFQIRQADSLRVMKSKPFAQSTNFRVSADMFIQPSLRIRSANLVAQAPAPVTPTPTPVTPVVPSTTGGGSGGGSSEKYDASDWILSRKYDELVREREERDGSFLTSAPESSELNFDYIPTNPNDVELVGPGFEFPNNIELEPSVTQTPAIYEPINSVGPSTNVAVLPPYVSPITNLNNAATAEQLLITAPINSDNLMVVELSKSQKKELLKSQGAGFNWPWSTGSKVSEEDWLSSSPSASVSEKTCIGCKDVLWWSWCSLVVMILLLILLLLIINTLLQIALFKFRVDKYTPDNPKSFLYRMKKFLKQIGLLSLALVSMSALAQAQVTTTPQLLIYEGELLDDTGTPAVGSFTFRFSFWDNSDYEATDVVGGNINVGAIDYRGWTEVQTTSTIADGSFSLQMSDVTPFTAGLFDQDNLFLQVEVKNAGDPDTAYEFVDINLTDPLEDRKIIASVPFAFNANKLDYKELGFGAGNIPYLDIAGLLPSTVIPDLDLTADDLDLADITLSDFTNDLTLNDGQVFIGDATNIANAVNISGDGTLDNTGLFTLALNSIGEDELDFGNVTLADFTNDVGFVTTDTLGDLACAANEIAKWDGLAWICSPDAGGAAFTASGGVTLTGSDFTADLGTDIETAEIQDDAVTIAKIGGAGIDQVLTSDGAGNAQWEDRSNFAISALTTNNIFVGDGAGVATDTAVTGDITMIGGNFQLVTNAVESAEIADDAVSDAEIDFANVTLNDFTNDAGFLTTVDVSDNTNLAAGTGIDLTDDTLSTTLGTTIEVSEIVSAGLADANKILTTDGVGAPQWEDKLNFATSVQGALADTALQAGDNVSTLTNDAGFLTAVDVSDNTNLAAGTGATLTGDILSVDLGTSIDAAEIDTNAVADDEIDYASVTLSDFTNDAGFLTTDSDTTYLAGLGLNLVGTTFSTTLGTAIDSSEITDGSIAGIDLDFGDITLSDFTNDAGFLTAVDVSDNTNLAAGTGATLTGDTISVDLGTSIDAAEIDTNAVNDDEINYANVTLADFTNDAGYLNTVDISADTNLAVGAGLMLVGDSIISDLGSDIISAEIVDGTITDSDLNLASITLNDFTNDSGFITAETQDISLVGSNLSITGGSTIDLSVIDTNTDTLSDLGCAPGEVAKWNGTAWVCAPDSGGTSYTASDGVTLVGSNFTNDFGSSIESNEITNGTIGDQDLNLTDITLADFTNDVGFITTDGDTLNDLACAANEIARFNGTIWVCAGGPVSITKVLSPRYAGSIFEADGTNNTGSMHEEEDTTLSGTLDTVLRWFSRQVVLNDYDIIVEWTIPDDFDSFEPTPLSLDYQTDGLVSDALIDMTVHHNGDADDEIIGTGIALNSNAWTTTNFVVDGTTTWNVGDTMKIRLTMKAKDSNSAQVGNIKINYVRK